MKRFNSDIKDNPSFNTVNGLSNKTFDPENIVSGRGATEDQLKVVGDVVKDLDDYITEFGCSDCEEKYQSLEQQISDLEIQQEECCQNRITQENFDAIVNEINDRLDNLELRIETCCADKCFDGGGGGDASACSGSQVTVTMTWDADPVNNGGQINASSSSGANIIFYYFLVKTESGAWVPTGIVSCADKQYKVNGSTGKISITSTTGNGHQFFAVGARDANGCEGIGVAIRDGA